MEIEVEVEEGQEVEVEDQEEWEEEPKFLLSLIDWKESLLLKDLKIL